MQIDFDDDVIDQTLAKGQQRLFDARVSEEEQARLPQGAQLIPGMPVEALIRTGDRSTIEFLTQPLTDFFTRVFRES